MSSEQPKEPAQKWYRISETQLINLKDAPKQEQADEMAENIKRQRIKIDHNGIHGKTCPGPAPKFNSTELILLAHDEWKRREERKHNHSEQDWVAGYLNGFCTSRKWAREYVDKLQAGEHR